MTVFQFILAALACYRLTVLIARDRGPWKMFERLRMLSPKWLGCPFCVSVSIAMAIEAGFYFSGFRDSYVVIACIVMAISAVAIILDRCFTIDHKP